MVVATVGEVLVGDSLVLQDTYVGASNDLCTQIIVLCPVDVVMLGPRWRRRIGRCGRRRVLEDRLTGPELRKSLRRVRCPLVVLAGDDGRTGAVDNVDDPLVPQQVEARFIVSTSSRVAREHPSRRGRRCTYIASRPSDVCTL